MTQKTNHSKTIAEMKNRFSEIETERQMAAFKKDVKAFRKVFKDDDRSKDFVDLLKFLRQRKMIEVGDEYILNMIERDACENVAVLKNKIDAGAYKLDLNDEVKFSSYYDETRESEMFTIYVNRILAPEEQIGRELAGKIDRGFMPSESDYEPEKVLVDKFPMRESEFKKYFEVQV